MPFDSFDGNELVTMLVGSANLLAERRAEIDALNVFPVPDGDTGTNMYLTFLSGVKEARKKSSFSAGEVASSVAHGCLLGARGNSGVILSQIMHGFAKALEGKDKIYTTDVSEAFTEGTKYAYRSVMNPVEGTMLTVCRRFSVAFEEGVRRKYDMLRSMLHAYRLAQQTLEKTPEMLPVLKEAGVVDAGGRGLVVIIEGILRALKMVATRQQMELFDLASSQQRDFMVQTGDINSVIEYTYCTEMIIKGRGLFLDQVRSELSPYGDCVMVVGNDEIAKVHIHSNHPGLVMECCLKYGALHNVRVSNMEEQQREFNQPNDREKPLGVVSIGLGEGIKNIMESLGVDVVISGGQTMNPSIESILDAVNQVRSQKVLLLPNNGNVVMAAEQAAAMSEKDVLVVKTVNIPQGLTAMLAYNPYGNLEDVARNMTLATEGIRYGEVTKAVKDSSLDGRSIKSGEFIAITDNRIITSGPDIYPVVKSLADILVINRAEILTLYYGGGMSGYEARSVTEMLGGDYADLEIEIYYGGQPHYHFIVSAE